MYFERFDIVSYDPRGLGKGKDATNILNALLVKYLPATNTTEYFFHTVKFGEKPEDLAHMFYGNPNLHWIILLMNNVIDPFYDWVMDSNQFSAMMVSRYGSGHEGDVHHFIDLTTDKRIDEVATLDTIDFFDTNGYYPVNISPVTNYEYEVERNDSKREVKILRQRYVQTFVNQFEDLMNRELLV